MKRKNLVVALAFTLMVGLGTTVYAATNNNENNNTVRNCAGTGIGKITGFRGYDIISNILKDKGVTDSQITDSLKSGKTLHDIAEDKGISDDELKNSIIQEKTKIIDDAIAKGTITKEQGDAAKERIKENSANCTASGNMANHAGGRNNGAGKNGSIGRGGCQGFYSNTNK